MTTRSSGVPPPTRSTAAPTATSIRGGLGQDTLTAGTGFGPADILSYDDAARTSPLSMTFTPNAATTPNPDGDAVSTGFDGIEGTPLGDALTAGATGAVLRGAEGDDLLQGGPAVDRFDGGDGADIIHADDGNAETVDCGAGIDQFFTFDAGDTLIGCEGPQPIDPGPAPGGGAAPAQAGVLPVALTGAATTGAGPGGPRCAPSARRSPRRSASAAPRRPSRRSPRRSCLPARA